MCRVLNKRAAGRHDGAIYIGRGSKWGVRFGSASMAIADRYRQACKLVARPASLAARARRASREGSAVLLRAGGVPRRSVATARERDP